LVSGLAPLVLGTGATWIAAAMSDGDRAAAAQGVVEAEGLRVRLLAIDPDTYRAAYDVVCNATLWFAYHGLFDRARRPRIDSTWRRAWEAYRRYNRAFADAIDDAAPRGAAVLVQDYHLALLGPMLAESRRDLATIHFSHTPFCGPDELRALPDEAAAELLAGMAGHDACGFHTTRWADRFRACCAEVLGIEPSTFVSPLAADEPDLRAVAASPRCERALEGLMADVGNRKLVLRVDRVELSKNLLRGFYAFDDLLERHPAWREQVVFAALVYPSREGLAEYLAYRQEVEGLVERLNDKWSTPGWTPILYDASDDYPRSVAALRRYDVLLVNPIRDGLNLVAKEGPIVNERDGVVVLSREAGAWFELGDAGVISVNPFDVASTADALASALAMDGPERSRRAASVRAAAVAHRPDDWLDDQLSAARR
jgi:trehalose 6-phosphate synthase